MNPKSWKTKPFAHQIDDVASLLEKPEYGLFNEMGTGKSKTVVDAACELAEAGKIDTVFVVSPAAVRSVWVDEEFGEIKKHAWIPSRVFEHHAGKTKTIWQDKGARLNWVITNYEYIRPMKNREALIGLLSGLKLMMVLDESAFIKNRKAIQTKACVQLGKMASRKIILNGTPIPNNPLDLWSQLEFLNPRILPFHNFYQFRSAFAIMGGWKNKQVIRWRNLEGLQEIVKPYVVRREKKDCLDLPEKVYTTRDVPMTEESWAIYKKMRDEAVVWLENNPSMAAQAGVRVMRLSQITSGYLGGLQTDDVLAPKLPAMQIGTEKLDDLREFVAEQLSRDPSFKLIVWFRFVAELERAAESLKDMLPTFKLYSDQTKAERDESKRRFSEMELSSGPAVLCGQPQAGGFGLNLVAAHTVFRASRDHNLMILLQSDDRVHRPGQRMSVLYVDQIATGPKGQRTIDHTTVAALRNKEDLATWTVAAWKKALLEEVE